MFMRKLITVVALVFSMGLAAQTKTYQGAWFSIDYPEDFTVKNSILSETRGDNTYDSATFTSPDKTVVFYVYSPQWSGTPSDITLKESGQQQQLQADNLGNVITLYSFYQGKDKRTHSYQVTRNADQQITQVIGLRYTSMKAYEKYRKAYIAFKASLQQYAD